jgi:cellulose synthase (UDP-forming)
MFASAGLRVRVFVLLVVSLSSAVAVTFASIDLIEFSRGAIARANVEQCIEILILYIPFFLITYGSFIFQLADYGELNRVTRHAPATTAEIETLYDRKVSDLLILVPAYKEDEEVIRKTLLSAALLDYPRRRVVLLIDDPPGPGTKADSQLLEAARALPGELQALFEPPAERLRAELAAHIVRKEQQEIDPIEECRRLARAYEYAATWFETRVTAICGGNAAIDHVERFFIDRVLLEPARSHRARAMQLKGDPPAISEISREYRRIASLFEVEFSSFERKRYQNLSHAANKAMNLNSYLGLMGKSFCESSRDDGLYLEECGRQNALFSVPNVDYVVTLDADTLVLSDYALRLVRIMEQPGNSRLAVAQTPYSAFPGAPALLEQMAGATTDVQYLNHQGSTYFNATSWVGANALLRRSALEDIAVEVEERGHRIKVFIQDKTVVEDTAATIDLILKGWRLHNYHERLAYSATPPDFGALLIQRRRWANGGLILLPNLLRYIFSRPALLSALSEGALRSYYLISTCVISVGVLTIILYRFDDSMLSVWLPLAASPYLLLYGHNLVRAGYRWRDFPRVYALNMLLLPVNLGGTLQSVQQIFTGRKAAFTRTPKVSGRTSVPLRYLLAEYSLLLYCTYCAVVDALDGRIYHFAFTSINSAAFLYGISRFIGHKNSLQDLLMSLRSRRWSSTTVSWAISQAKAGFNYR